MSTGSVAGAKKKRAPWFGRKRVKDPRKRTFPLRCTDEELAGMKAAAAKAGFSLAAFLRKLALGDAGPRAVRRPPAERAELARLLGQIGKIGSNVNQLAHAYNQLGKVPGFPELLAIRREVAEMRAALMKALDRDH